MKHLIYFILITLLKTNLYAKNNITELITEENLICAEDAIKLLEAYRVEEALTISKFCKDPAIEKMVIWLSLYDNYLINPQEYIKFIYQNKNFPAHKRLKRNLEKNLNQDISHYDILNFYYNYLPNTYEGFQLFLNASTKNINIEFQKDISKALYREYFLSNNFPQSKLIEFIEEKHVDENIILKKIHNLLNNKEIKIAKKLLKYAPKNHQALFQTRILFIKNNKKGLSKIKSLDANLANNSDLYFDLISFLERRDQDDKITKYILSLEPSSQNKKWSAKRLRNARYLINKKQYKTAYKVVANHHIKELSLAYNELEWFAGWIALRFLNKPHIAINHFQKMHDNVNYAISIARASYWLARSYSQINQGFLANKYYQKASSYNTTYYGQMAMLELNNEIMINLPKSNIIDPNNIKNFLAEEEQARIALYFSSLKQNKKAEIFLKNLIINHRENAEIIITLANYSNNQEIINKIARHATRYNIITIDNYPLIKNLPSKYEVKYYSLIMSIIKQESGFSNNAVSKAGALGFMQLMPATAKQVAQKLKTHYSKYKLQTNSSYNIKLGSYYLKSLLNKFDNSYILAIASYNAGPKNTKRWIKENGDPRNFTDIYEIIDWVEKISFSETRNYVQRILENSVIYNHLISAKIKKIPLPKLKPQN